MSPWRLCVAPMLDWTDRHCRYFHRLITRRTRLYTEMVTTGALRHGDVALAQLGLTLDVGDTDEQRGTGQQRRHRQQQELAAEAADPPPPDPEEPCLHALRLR